MYIVLLLIVVNAEEKVLEVRYTEVVPRIDGIIEELWHNADSASDFIQYYPYEKGTPTDSTTVYVLQDSSNLYIAFRCYNLVEKAMVYPGGYEDFIQVNIDPLGNQTTAYFFKVTISGFIEDGMILNGGRNSDDSWDGVWYRSTKVYDDYYEVEIKIPFKSIRYKKNLSEWGVTFKRYIASKREQIYWNEVSLKEGVLISKYGSLKGINAQASGHYFELYPEGYVRYDEYNARSRIKPSASLNFKWDVTPQATVNATVYPDFAQIESDPYTLNLSRYPVYLRERRPFFIEGIEIFRMSSMGNYGLHEPMDIFYSRRIGKSMGEEVVPIISGAKFTAKSVKYNVGILSAYADEYRDTADLLIEPRRLFGVVRAMRQIYTNTDIGLLFAGTMVDDNEYNYSLGLDATYNQKSMIFTMQGAMSDKNRKRDWALSGGYSFLPKNFLFMGRWDVVQDSFDVSDIGFVPWAGKKEIEIWNAYWGIYSSGFCRDWSIGPGFKLIQESGSDDLSKIFYIHTWPSFRNGMELCARITIGRCYEADTNYFKRNAYLSFWRDGSKTWWGVTLNYKYNYNYSRNFVAYNGSNQCWAGLRVIPNLALSAETNVWIEWDTTGSILATTPAGRFEIQYSISRDITLNIFNEIVMTVPENDLNKIELSSNRIGVLFAWNFQPKSWFYVAFNDYRKSDEYGDLTAVSRIGAVKIKYLLYF